MRFYPNDLDMHSFDNGFNLERKMSNWDYLLRFFKKKKLDIDSNEIERVMHCDQGAAEEFIIHLYEVLTDSHTILSKKNITDKVPDYAKPTISFKVKDLEIGRIKDKKKKSEKLAKIVEDHDEALKIERPQIS